MERVRSGIAGEPLRTFFRSGLSGFTIDMAVKIIGKSDMNTPEERKDV